MCARASPISRLFSELIDSPMTSYEFSYEASPELARMASLRFIWRRAGWQLILLVIAALACLFLLFTGTHDWYVFVLLTIAGVKIRAWIEVYYRSGKIVADVADRTVNICVNDNALEMEFAHAKTKIRWDAPIQICKFKSLWLISFFATRHPTYIPTTILSDEVRDFIEEKVIKNGGTVT